MPCAPYLGCITNHFRVSQISMFHVSMISVVPNYLSIPELAMLFFFFLFFYHAEYALVNEIRK